MATLKLPWAENLPPPALCNLKGETSFESVADVAGFARNDHRAWRVFDASFIPTFSTVGLKMTRHARSELKFGRRLHASKLYRRSVVTTLVLALALLLPSSASGCNLQP